MNTMKKITALVCLALLAAGANALDAAAETGGVRVFEAGELSLDRYTVIERLWTGTWRAAFWLPSYDDAGAAITALTNEAGRLGAEGGGPAGATAPANVNRLLYGPRDHRLTTQTHTIVYS